MERALNVSEKNRLDEHLKKTCEDKNRTIQKAYVFDDLVFYELESQHSHIKGVLFL
ncbi:hypothetical protein [Halobacillus litoralis]|uniref:hypothetical protein n=1 Tax=Halobacillus litoralis TaxID=45668 RepID=UPI001CD2DF94|nr:hypothetical protein [Halobacillus litoralis]MCA1024442.1 hypothetical protein [Halobacillus litoralis]